MALRLRAPRLFFCARLFSSGCVSAVKVGTNANNVILEPRFNNLELTWWVSRPSSVVYMRRHGNAMEELEHKRRNCVSSGEDHVSWCQIESSAPVTTSAAAAAVVVVVVLDGL